MDQHVYRSRRFAEMASVSVRTLRYYDKMGLLSPSQYSESGHRLYTSDDLLILQNILALKFLGFALEEIKVLLQAGPKGLAEVLAQQKAMMEEKRAQLDSIIQALSQTEQLLQENRCNWEAITRVIQVIQMGEKNDYWITRHFTPEQQQTMNDLTKQAYTPEALQKLKDLHPHPWTAEDQQRVDEQYLFVKRELGRLVATNAAPASAEAQEVARIKHELNVGFAQGNADLEASVGKWWEGFYALPDEQRPFDTSVYTYTQEEQDFLQKALEIFRQQ